MGGASSWYTMLSITGFLVAVWLAGRVSKKIGMSSIILEVATGIVLGPSAAKLIPSALSQCYDSKVTDCSTRDAQVTIAQKGYEFCDLKAYIEKDRYVLKGTWEQGFWGNHTAVNLDGKTYCLNPNDLTCRHRRLEDEDVGQPRRLAGDKKGKTNFDSYKECLEKSCELDVAVKCATTPDIFTMVGHTGVAMMIFESGMHFDFEQARTVGPWASAVAVLGTFLPLASGSALAVGFGFELVPDALAAGTALAPTSVGIALRLLHEAKALQMYFGQAVMTAAFVDDVLSLILFSCLFSLGDDPTFLTFLPIILGCVFMVVAVIGAVVAWPPFIKWLFSKIPEALSKGHKVTRHDEVMWILMFLTLVAYGQITHLCATHLWGCFIAGMCFSTQHHAHHVWVRQVKRVTVWFMRIFFACTLAWAIPLKELLSLEAFWKGSIMGIGPCILTKVLCAPFMGSARWVIGWAMVGRAEFAYFIAIMAKALKMIDDKLFAILIWALIYATIFAPVLFTTVLVRYMRSLDPEGNAELQVSSQAAAAASGHLPDMEVQDEMDLLQEEQDAKKKEVRENFQASLYKLQEKVDFLSQQVEASNKEASDAKFEAEVTKRVKAELAAVVIKK